jgi:hypothetical protein
MVSATTFDTTHITNSPVTPPVDPNQNSLSKTNVTLSGGQSILTLPPQIGGSGLIDLSAASGLYNGLFYNTNGVATENSGYATINVTTGGSFSGKLANRGQTYSFSGRFDSTGHTTGLIARKGASPLTFDLQIDLHGGEKITGRIAAGGLWEASLQTYRVGINSANPLALAGKYTFVIPGNGSGVNAPGGNSVGSVSLDAAGNVQWSGFLADGSNVGQKTTLSKNNVWPLYASLYNGGGLVIGWMQMDTNAALAGEAIWIKTRGSSGMYAGGYTNSITISGSGYKAPPTAFAAFGNSEIRFDGNNVGFVNPVFWGGTKIFNRGANSLSLSLTPATGLFKGTAVEPSTGNKISFQGVLLENNNVGLGYFLKNGQSGAVNFAPAP